MKEKKIVALLSPNKNAYSETFIQAHKNYLDANIKFYYHGFLPDSLEDEIFPKPRLIDRLFRLFFKKMKNSYNLSLGEYMLMKSFKEQCIEKVYAEYGPTAVSVLKVCKIMNLPLIVNFHGADISVKDNLALYLDKYKEVVEFAESIVVVSKSMKSRLIDFGAKIDKITYTPCGPNDMFLNIKPTFKEKSFVAVGRFIDKKAQYYTILAFKKVVEIYPDAKLYLIGQGELFNTCKNLVRYYNLNEKVHFLGVVKQDEIVSLFESVSALVQHSITAENGDMEGTPVAVLEASASALPVISTYHSGISDVVIDGKTGLLVSEHDVNGMANNMIKILSNKELTAKLGKNGREHIKNNFAMNLHIAKLNELIYI